MIDLRPYQNDVLVQLGSSARRTILVAPTGSGKTVIASALIQHAVSDGARVLFLAHRRELVHQTQKHLGEFDVNAGIILAGEEYDPDAAVQVASIQTLWARTQVRDLMELPSADIVFVDEAHHSRAQTYQKLISSYPNARILGMTATPCRGDGRGLGNVFEQLVQCPQVAALIKMGFLVPTKVWAPSTPDLTGVRTARGDYVIGDLEQAVDQPHLVGDIVTHWHRHAQNRKTVVFATTVAHSSHIYREFAKAGVRIDHVDGSTPKDERDAILRRLSNGDLDVVTNCMVLTEGWDQPDVSCIILARPTKSFGLFRQMIGRGLRPYPGKSDCLVLDHAGATHRHGFAEDEVSWSLDVDHKAEAKSHKARIKIGAIHKLIDCPKCKAVMQAGRQCKACGYIAKPRAEDMRVADGDLARLMRGGGVKPQEWPPEAKGTFHAMLVHIANERGYNPGWAAHKFKDKFGCWPPRNLPTPIPPSREVLSWVRSKTIAWARSQEARGRYG